MIRARSVIRAAAIGMTFATSVGAQQRPTLPSGLDASTRQVIERLADSLRSVGLPAEPVYAKAAEGKLKLATDAQILVAVRTLARRFGEIRAALGVSVDAASMSAAASAVSAGVPLTALRELFDASSGSRDRNADFATALVTVTDLVVQRVPAALGTSAVQSLLVRRAPSEQYAQLRIGVTSDIQAGRSPEQAVRARTDAIVRSLPATLSAPVVKPPGPDIG